MRQSVVRSYALFDIIAQREDNHIIISPFHQLRLILFLFFSGAEVYQAGLIPNNRDAVIVAHDGHIELDFTKVKPVRVMPKLTSAHATEKQCDNAIKQDDNDHISRWVV